MSDALALLAAELRSEKTVISPHVRDPGDRPLFGELVATGPRAADAPGEYALLVESIREGYLLHYGEPRLVDDADDDLALLAGDHLYALGLRRLAALGDLPGIGELSDLISLSARLHSDGPPPDPGANVADALWLATAVAVGAGGGDAHERGKEALRDGTASAAELLWKAARDVADGSPMRDPLGRTAEAIGFARPDSDRLG